MKKARIVENEVCVLTRINEYDGPHVADFLENCNMLH